MKAHETIPSNDPFKIPFWIAICLFSAIALFFLWTEHEAHILGALPWLLILACPIIHLLLHRGHGRGRGHGGHGSPREPGDAP